VTTAILCYTLIVLVVLLVREVWQRGGRSALDNITAPEPLPVALEREARELHDVAREIRAEHPESARIKRDIAALETRKVTPFARKAARLRTLR
jgi:hypothetical protein